MLKLQCKTVVRRPGARGVFYCVLWSTVSVYEFAVVLNSECRLVYSRPPLLFLLRNNLWCLLRSFGCGSFPLAVLSCVLLFFGTTWCLLLREMERLPFYGRSGSLHCVGGAYIWKLICTTYDQHFCTHCAWLVRALCGLQVIGCMSFARCQFPMLLDDEGV